MKTRQLIISLAVLFLWGCSTSNSPTLEEEIRAVENGLMMAYVATGDSLVTYSIGERMERHKVPGVSVAVVREGKLRWAKGYGTANTSTGSKVDEQTLFQAGSISKPVAALAALKLWEEGKVDLDEDVNNYLQGWKVEETRFTENEKVTLRRLLTHTAGTTVHGFPGYSQTDTFPTIIQVLNGEGNTDKITVDTVPGSIWRYSGGGYTIMERVVEDVSGQPLEKYMEEQILGPLGMEHSTYAQPLPEAWHDRASAAYDSEGEPIEGLWHNYPEQAAAGLWTTPGDLARYCIAVQEMFAGKSEGILKTETVKSMLTKHKDDWGLGPALSSGGDSLKFGHGGKNAGFTNNMTAFARTGDALVVMTSGDNGGDLISEITRSVSRYYNLGLSEPEFIRLADTDTISFELFTGKYLFEEEVPEIGKYYIALTEEGEQLVVDDPNNGQRDLLNALDRKTFLDLEDGDRVVFTVAGDSISLLWNNRYRFFKVEQ